MRTNGFPSKDNGGHEAKYTARARRWVLVAVLATLAVAPLMAQDWSMFGNDAANSATNKSTISTNNVNQLKLKWTFTTGGDVSARAAVVSGVAYFPDWGGNLWAVDANSGQLIVAP
jgi:polyvinyl alcohol dehydrogenase (cytochrome)